jgi:hypothetical protein
MTEFVTHNVKRFILEKPRGYSFVPGQAIELHVNKMKWRKEGRPFTFTCLNDDKVLEFTIKIYPKRKGVTNELNKLKPGDKVLISKPFGTIKFKGKGVFIAGGAGVTPFIAILRELRRKNKIKGNKLIFSNKEQRDVILEQEFKDMLGNDLILTLSKEKVDGYEFGRVDEKLLKKYVKKFKGQNFYLCGPPPMLESMKMILGKLGARVDEIVFEK